MSVPVRCDKRTDKRENFLDDYIDLDSHGAHLAERESVQIGKKRYRFKINGVVTVGPEMLKGEIGDLAKNMKKTGKIPNYINKKSRERIRILGEAKIPLCRWLPQRWTPFIKDDLFGNQRVYEDWHMWYGGYFVDPFVASALAEWTFKKYTPNVEMNLEGVVQGKKIIALENGDARGAKVTLENLEMARLYFNLEHKRDVTKLIRKETLATHSASGKAYLLQFELLPNKQRKSPKSLDAVNKAMQDIFGGSPCATQFDVHRDTGDDANLNFNCIRNINDGEQTSITVGEEKIRCEFIDFLKELASSGRAPADLAKLEIQEDDDEPVTCASVLPRPIGEHLEKKLMKAAKGTPEELNRVMNQIKKRNCNELPDACTEAEVLKIIEKATLTHSPKGKKKESSKSKGKKRVRNSPSASLSSAEMEGLDVLLSDSGGVNDLPYVLEGVLASAGYTPTGHTPSRRATEQEIGRLNTANLYSLANVAGLVPRTGGVGPTSGSSPASGAGPTSSSSRAGGAGPNPGDEAFADGVMGYSNVGYGNVGYRGLRLRNQTLRLPIAKAFRGR